jgi:hypothetical protein
MLRRCTDRTACRCVSAVSMKSLNFADESSDNLAFIAKTRLGRNTVLEQSKFSLLLGDCQMFLLYDDILILKGNGSEEPCFAMDGLLEESMSLISKRMKQLDYPHLAIHLGRDTRYMMEDELRSGSARPEIQVEG